MTAIIKRNLVPYFTPHIKYILLCTLCFALNIHYSFAQNLGVNAVGATPHNSSIIDLNTGNTFTSPNGKGILPPNVALTSITDAVTVTSPPTSLWVYNTATAGAGTAAVAPGYYYWDGAKWARLQTTAGTAQDWSLLGNAGTTAGTNFLGTTDAQDLVFKTNGVENMRILNSNGNVGIGTTTPSTKFQVLGASSLPGSIGIMSIFDQAGGPAVLRMGLDNSTLGSEYAWIQSHGTRPLYINNTNNTILNLASSNVGIGTPTPGNKVEITQGTAGNSGLRFTNLPNASVLSTNASGDVIPAAASSATVNGVFWSLLGNNGTTATTNFIGTTDAVDWVIKTNNTEKMRVLSGGNVGIGTIAPAQKLSVENGEIQLGEVLGATALGRKLYFSNTGNSTDDIYFQRENISIDNSNLQLILGDNIGGDDKFLIKTLGSATPLLTLVNNGNVGISVANPGAKLDVLGRVQVSNVVDNVFGTVEGTSKHDLVGTYAGWDILGVYLAGYNAVNAPGVRATNKIYFGGAGSTRMMVDLVSGNVGIGTTTPRGKLDVMNGDAYIADNIYPQNSYNVGRSTNSVFSDNIKPFTDNGLRVYDGNSNSHLHFEAYSSCEIQAYTTSGSAPNLLETAGTESPLFLNPRGGSIGIGTTAPTALLSVNGTANNPAGAWGIFSDARVKTVDADFTDGLEIIKNIHPVKFHYNANAPFNSDKQQIGVVAQELEKVASYMVDKKEYKDIKDLREVNQQAYIFLLINAVKEQQKQIEAQQKRIEKLEKK